MIVLCRKCGTKFRFDDGLIAEEGAWLRCSRCRNVFFQEPLGPPKETTPSMVEPAVEAAPHAPSPAQQMAMEENTPELAPSQPIGEEITPPAGEDIQYDVSRLEDYSPDRLPSLEKEEHIPDEDGYAPEALPKRRKSKVGAFFAYLLLFIVILGASAYGYYRFYPDQAREFIGIASRHLPWLSGWLGLEKTTLPLSQSVQFVEIRQRFLHNVILGSLRIVDGKIVNSGPHPLTRLKVKGELYNVQGQILGERTVFSGNTLSDEDLMHATEEEIMKILNRPEGIAFMNDRIPSGGQIPFMLVFIRENQGAEKTLVRLAGGEILPR